MARVQLEHVTKRYGDHAVLTDVNLNVHAGDFVIVRGASGTGKTTLLQVLGLLENATTGRVLVNARDANALTANERARERLLTMGHVFQSHNMIPSLTLLENVLLPMRFAKRVDHARARDLLADVGLADKADALPGRVSIGQRQRAAFARALANDPAVIIADEPTASLDDANARLVTDHLTRLAGDGKAVIVASHDARILQHAPGARVVTVHAGRVTETRAVEREV